MDSDNNNDSKPGHSKKVSWDAALQKLKADNDKKKQLMQQHGSTSKLSMSDVLASTPVEQEAETLILRAFEKVNSGHPGNNETDSLFRDIAADEISRASNERTGDESGSCKTITVVEPAPEVADDPSDQRSQSQAQATTVANTGNGKARFKSLVKKHMANNKDHSVEQTLFGLSAALSHMDENSRKQTSSSSLKTPLKEAVDGEIDLEAQDSTEYPSEEGFSDSDVDNEQSISHKNRKKRHKVFLVDSVTENLEQNWDVFSSFVGSRTATAKAYGRKAIMYIMLPSLAIAAILFYLVENPSLCEAKVPELEVDGQVMGVATQPPTEIVEGIYDVNGTLIGNSTVAPTEGPKLQVFVCPGLGASVSWWFLFMGVRQVVTFTLALLTQLLVVDYFALASRFCLNWLGPVVTLFFVQAKGWPFVAVFWAIYDLILLSGDKEFAHHWGYWQDWISLFNEENPSGNVVDHEWNTKVLRLTIFIGIAVAIKRLFVVLFLGRQTFARYGEQLAEIMKSMVLIGEVATLAKDIERSSGDYANTTTALPSTSESAETKSNQYQDIWQSEIEQNGSDNSIPIANAAEAANKFIANRNVSPVEVGGPIPTISASRRNLNVASDNEFSHSQQMKLSEMLDAWEEPQTAEQKEEKNISIGAVLQFRQALAFMKVRYPFLPAFGLADTRQHCIESAQEVYDRLLLRTPEQSILPFDTLALLAKDDENGIDQNKAKLLIKAFRPDRDGKLSKLDFVKSCDSVYKSIRLLSANISNSSQIDGAVEGIFNCLFYFILGAITLAYLGVDPLQVFLSFSSVILAFAFMFGSSSSKYFEGILFILGQAPYGVGDRIHLSNPAQETSIDGSSGWIVEKVSLYKTSLYWGATNERATIANGAISNLRVINAARSPCAQVFVNMKFPIDTPYEKIEIFKAAIEQFLKDRPREWLAFVGFRPTEVAVEKGYINYVTIAQHRTSWQDIGGVLTSKAELVTYELEVAKQLEMKYSAPHLPVDLKLSGSESDLPPKDIMDLAMKE